MIENGPKLMKPKGSASESTTASPVASGTATSEAYDLIGMNEFALEYQIACTGTPNAKIQLQQSCDNSNWYIPDNIADINSSVTDENLHGIKLGPIPVRYLRLKVTELTGIVSDTVVTFKVSAQRKDAA